MDIEFHYWMNGIIAKHAGFPEDEARTIAYSSQYVDDNDIALSVLNKSTGKKYRNFISQTMNILKPKDQLMRIYPLFHFVPGDPGSPFARRRDGKMHVLNTTPDSEAAHEFLNEAFKSTEDVRLYRIGIASHAYADTWAHQNFAGWYDNFNALGVNALPNIGHADAQHHPDWPGHRWTDNRIVENDISNNHRFLSAAERLFQKYCDFLIFQKRYTEDERPDWNTLETQLKDALGSACARDENYYCAIRLASYRNLAPWLTEYDEKTWFDDAVKTDVRGFKDSHEGILSNFTIFKDEYSWREDRDIQSTDWFKFQAAVKEHERFGITLLDSIFKQMDVDVSKV